MTKTEREETEALMWAGVPEIPAAVTETTPVWIYAIAKVLLTSARESFAIVKMDYGRDPKVVKSFAGDEGVARIQSVHPYKFLDQAFMPKLGTAAEVKQYISEAYCAPLEKVKGLKKPELLRLLYAYCIKQQLEEEKKQK